MSAGQSHLNSDATIAHEGRPQGAPLPDSFGPGEGTHKGRPYRFVWPWGGHPQGAPLPIRLAWGRAPTRGAPTDSFGPGEGTHKGCPYPIRLALGRAPTRGAPTDSFGPGKGTHKGCPYRFVWPWGGHPQGVPLPDSGSLTWFCPNLMQLSWGGAGRAATRSQASF